MTAVLTSSQQSQVVTLFANNVYAGLGQTATNGTDVLKTVVGSFDAAVSISIGSGAASISADASLIGNFTAQQLQVLLGYVLLKRAGVI